MSNDSKPRNMTVKGFLHKASGKAGASASGFLTQHRGWLQTGEIAEVTSPILRLLDEGQIYPTPALDLIKEAVLAHHLQREVEKAEARMAEAQDPSSHSSKPWVATVYTARGEVVQDKDGEDLTKSFQMAHHADRWADLRLVEAEPDTFVTVVHTSLMRADGSPISSVILRGDAMARILRSKKQPAMRRTTGAAQKLSFGVKVHESRATFSHG